MQRNGFLRPRAGSQSGATAVEFALLFPFLFMVIYSGIVYGFVFFLQQRVNFATQEAVRAAISIDPSVSNYTDKVKTIVQSTVGLNFGVGVGGKFPPRLAVLDPTTPQTGTVQVDVTYSLASPGPIFPQLSLPGLDAKLPPFPTALTGRAVGRVS